MKRIDALRYSTGSFEYETDDGPVEVFYTFEPGDPDVGSAKERSESSCQSATSSRSL